MIAHNVSTSSGEWGVMSRTTVGASGLTSVSILPPYQDAAEREYQVQSWINTGHAIEGNMAVGNKSGGISIRGTSNSIVAGNITALNNQAQSTWGVAGISVGFGDGEGSEVPSVENVVADNRSYDDQQNRTQAYGLRFQTGANLAVGNDAIGNAIDGYVDESGNNAVEGSENNR
jgi:parallel beta-helix repeat protein